MESTQRRRVGFSLCGIAATILFGTLFLHLSPGSAKASGVDLHAHLFMKEGLGVFFQGDFFSDLRAENWSDSLSSQVNEQSLEASKLSIVVAALYAHPFFKLSVKDAIRAQITLANQFLSKHPNWVLAKSPDEASSALRQNRRVLILSLEGAAGVLDTDADVEEFIVRDGVRIVTLAHLTDDELGGAAFLGSFRAWSTPFAFLYGFIDRHTDPLGNWVNGTGLTPRGKALAELLLSKQVWIDLAHLSDQGQLDLIPILEKYHQPHLYTHTSVRKLYPAERAISEDQIKAVGTSGGILGLMPSPVMLKNVLTNGKCEGTLEVLLQHYEETRKSVPSESISIGGDWNGAIAHLKPPSPECPLSSLNCNHTEAHSFCSKGLWTIAQSPYLWDLLIKKAAWHPSPAAFISAWRKAWSRP